MFSAKNYFNLHKGLGSGTAGTSLRLSRLRQKGQTYLFASGEWICMRFMHIYMQLLIVHKWKRWKDFVGYNNCDMISNNHPTVSARQFVELPREIRTDSAISLKRKRSYKNLHLSVKYIDHNDTYVCICM